MFEMFIPLGYFSPCEAIVRAAFSIKFEAGLPWDILVRLYFVDLCCSLYMIGTTIHSYIHFIYILYFVCLSLSFRIHRRSCSLDDSGRPGAWWLWPKALGHDAGTTAAAVGGDRLRQPPVGLGVRKIFPSQDVTPSIAYSKGLDAHE